MTPPANAIDAAKTSETLFCMKKTTHAPSGAQAPASITSAKAMARDSMALNLVRNPFAFSAQQRPSVASLMHHNSLQEPKL
jgi:hypothetical protein